VSDDRIHALRRHGTKPRKSGPQHGARAEGTTRPNFVPYFSVVVFLTIMTKSWRCGR
jgi:hypothetical protein